MNINVKSCQRCGKDHDGMEFHPLLNPADEWTYYGTCPNTNQPVLLKIRETKDEARDPAKN